jgi:hypothetical protein
MSPIADDKKYSTDTRGYRTAVLQDGLLDTKQNGKIIPGHFDESPISAQLQMKDICIYKPGDLNKVGKEGKTSWDSFSYALLMGHNVWMHITAVQEANRRFDAGEHPYMMEYSGPNREKFADLVEASFAAPTKQASLDIIKFYETYWMEVVGTRGFKGKKAKNAHTQAKVHLEIEGTGVKLDKEKKEQPKPVLLPSLFEE